MNYWIIPCNTKYYNHEKAFSCLTEIDWRQSANMCEGDIVYIYVGRPISAILYKCEVIKADMERSDGADEKYIIGDLKKANRYMRLKLITKYPENKFNKNIILDRGVKTIQGPSRVSEEFVKFIEK